MGLGGGSKFPVGFGRLRLARRAVVLRRRSGMDKRCPGSLEPGLAYRRLVTSASFCMEESARAVGCGLAGLGTSVALRFQITRVGLLGWVKAVPWSRELVVRRLLP